VGVATIVVVLLYRSELDEAMGAIDSEAVGGITIGTEAVVVEPWPAGTDGMVAGVEL
jgi:hypothetical protein